MQFCFHQPANMSISICSWLGELVVSMIMVLSEYFMKCVPGLVLHSHWCRANRIKEITEPRGTC